MLVVTILTTHTVDLEATILNVYMRNYTNTFTYQCNETKSNESENYHNTEIQTICWSSVIFLSDAPSLFFLTISGEAYPLSPIRRSSISSSLPCIGLDSTWSRKRLSFSKFPYNATSMRTPRHSRKKDFSRRPLWYFIITAQIGCSSDVLFCKKNGVAIALQLMK